MMARGILGKKLGMTQIFEADGTLVPVTVVEAGPCVVLANKTEETDVLLKLLNIKSAIRLQLTSLQLVISLTP